MAIKGGVVSLSIAWHCNLDYDFMSHCLPRYNFRILDDFGWNFRHAKYHEENRRTLYKMYGIKVSGGREKERRGKQCPKRAVAGGGARNRPDSIIRFPINFLNGLLEKLLG